MEHAFFECPANYDLPDQLLTLLRRHQPGLNSKQVLTLNLELDPTMELSMVWISVIVLSSLWKQRKEGRVIPAHTRSELENRCCLLR